MSFFVYHRYGDSEGNPPLSSFSALLDELEDRLDDEEHASVSVVHETEWCLGISRNGYVTFENVEADDEPRHMVGVPREKLLEMMADLARGDIPKLNGELWKPGY